MTTKKTKKQAAPAKPGRATDIPLENIPDRHKTFYTAEFKQQAVDRYNAGEGAERIARDMDISTASLVTKWVHTVKEGGSLENQRGGNYGPRKDKGLAATLRGALADAITARNERLEAAACIVEADGPTREGTETAKRIRGWMRDA